MKNAIARLLRTIFTFIITFVTESVNSVSEGIGKGDVKKVAFHVTLLCSAATAMILFIYAIIRLAMRNMHILIIAGFLAAAAYSAVQKLFQAEEPEPPRRPTTADYQAVLSTVKPALATVCPVLGLAPIYEHTDISADPEEQILPWGKVWRMKFKVLKRDTTTPIDKDRCRNVIQAQVKSVLERDNPSGFANIRFQRGGTSVPIIQVDEVLPGDAFVYLFMVIASQEYFQQKSDWENRKNVLPTGPNIDDEDFNHDNS